MTSQRKRIALDGLWDFCFVAGAQVRDVDPDALVFDDTMLVPACFDTVPPYLGKRGVAAYSKDLSIPEAGAWRLVFEAANFTARVFLDGERLSEHFGGYTRFQVDAPALAPGDHRLVVLVDNVFDTSVNALHWGKYDWYQHGGLTGPVSLEHLGETWIDRVRLTTVAWKEGRVRVSLEPGGQGGRLPLAIAVDGRSVLDETVDATPGAAIEREVTIPECIPWSDRNPHLYDVCVQLGKDALRVRTGVRQIRVEGDQILLNDAPVRLVGVNRHHLHPEVGCALGPQLSFADARLIKDLGCNFVRGAHYPQDGRFLDICDELGLLVWEESLGWNLWSDEPNDPLFVSQCLAHTTEMVEASANHASVILYGILNECHSDREPNRETYRVLLERIRERDPSRPVTYAGNAYDKDLCLDLVDVVSFNVYPRWYDNLPHPDDVAGCFAWLKKVARDRAGAVRPIIVSEIGGGAIYGVRDPYKPLWSEEYQAELIEEVVRAFLDSDFAGLAIWQFCDCRTSEETWLALRRPRGFNNKGIVDEYRRGKLAANVVRRLLTERKGRE